MSKTEPINEAVLRDDLDALKDDLKSLRSDMRGLVRDLMSAGKTSAGKVSDRVTDAVGDAVETTRQHGRDAADTFESQVRDKPYTSCGIAFAAGALVTALMLSRRS